MAFLNWPIKTYMWKSCDRDVACLQLVYFYVTQPCLHTLMQARLSANQSMHTIPVMELHFVTER